MAVKSDRWIRRMATEAKMIEPFSERVGGEGIISWGLQPAGYDIRLDPAIRVFDWASAQGATLDPLNLDPRLYQEKSAHPHFDIPPNGFVQGMSMEYLRIPATISAEGLGKTTYSSVGISVNISSIAPGFEGRLRIHIGNKAPVPVRIYGGMGIAFLQFSELDETCETPYGELAGARFQGQRHFLAPPSRSGRRA